MSQPDDESANALYGEYLCYSKSDWVAGLPYLTKGSDSKVKSLAATDLTKPRRTADQNALADGWWEIADRYTANEDSLRGAISGTKRYFGIYGHFPVFNRSNKRRSRSGSPRDNSS